MRAGGDGCVCVCVCVWDPVRAAVLRCVGVCAGSVGGCLCYLFLVMHYPPALMMIFPLVSASLLGAKPDQA